MLRMHPSVKSAFPTVVPKRDPKIMDDVWEMYQSELARVELFLQQRIASEAPLINEIAQYMLSSGGKRMRPLLLVATSHLCNYPGDDHIRLASVVEFIHSATLLHDDVIDQGEIRRGKKAVRSLWGNHASILVGDYLYSDAMALGLSLENTAVNLALLEACQRMIEGEVIQHSRHSDIGLTEEDYLRIIRSKTASLIAATCRLSGLIASVSPAQREALWDFGHNLGMAFQVADDTLDYVASGERLGKALGKDLDEGKITLPLLHLLQSCSPAERREIRRVIEGEGRPQIELTFIVELMHRYGSVQYATAVAHGFVGLAKARLAAFEDSPHKSALAVVADYVVSRDH
jgi:octaprenyl-diphosphate synthase